MATKPPPSINITHQSPSHGNSEARCARCAAPGLRPGSAAGPPAPRRRPGLRPRPREGKLLGKAKNRWENHGKIIWNHGKIVKNIWNHGRIVGKSSEITGKSWKTSEIMGESWGNNLKSWEIHRSIVGKSWGKCTFIAGWMRFWTLGDGSRMMKGE